MQNQNDDDEVLRINFSISKKADPILFDELCKFSKGTKRAEHLRALAHDGVLARNNWLISINTALTKGIPTLASPKRSLRNENNKGQDQLGSASIAFFSDETNA